MGQESVLGYTWKAEYKWEFLFCLSVLNLQTHTHLITSIPSCCWRQCELLILLNLFFFFFPMTWGISEQNPSTEITTNHALTQASGCFWVDYCSSMSGSFRFSVGSHSEDDLHVHMIQDMTRRLLSWEQRIRWQKQERLAAKEKKQKKQL